MMIVDLLKRGVYAVVKCPSFIAARTVGTDTIRIVSRSMKVNRGDHIVLVLDQEKGLWIFCPNFILTRTTRTTWTL